MSPMPPGRPAWITWSDEWVRRGLAAMTETIDPVWTMRRLVATPRGV